MTEEQMRELELRLIAMGDKELSPLVDAFDLVRQLNDHDGNKLIRAKAHRFATSGNSQANDLYYRSHLFDAKIDFDSYMIYMEKNRDMQKQFYVPRRKQLYPVVRAMQKLADRKLSLLAVSMPPGTGKSTLALFYLTWLSGRNPEKPILTGSHANSFLHGAYDECIRMMDPQGDYLWNDVFGEYKIISTNAKDMLIDIGKDRRDGKRFTTLEFSSVGSGNAGKVRAENLLYCDDLIPDLETALSAERLEKLWGQYTTDLRQRKIGDCVELHIATRWSVRDVIGRLEAIYSDDPDAEFITIPALNENDESNFDYPIEAGFTTAFYHEQRSIMDDASWKALYMNQPIEREGLLYPENELRRYFELPEGEPDAILSVCDTKDRGEDYCVMPIAYQYGNDYYIEDVICDNSSPEVVESRLTAKCLQHGIQRSRFESNSAGGRIAEKIQNEVRANGGKTKITTKYTTAHKETKIVMAEPFVKQHFLFKDRSVYEDAFYHDARSSVETPNNKEYRRFMNFLCSYTMMGKNKHDDVPDAIAMLAEFVEGFTAARVEVVQRLW